MNHRIRACLPTIGLLGLVLTPDAALASSGGGADDYLAITQSVAPNILYVIDLSSDMDQPCSDVGGEDTGSSGSSDTGGDTGGLIIDTGRGEAFGGGGSAQAGSGSSSSESCLSVVLDSINIMMQHYDWARYGVIGTTDSDSDDGYYPIAPIGSSYAEIAAALSSVTVHSGASTRNLAEAISAAATDYLASSTTEDEVDDDGDGFTQDWTEGPILYACQDTHIIVITSDRPEGDDAVPSFYKPDIEGLFGYTDIKCDDSGLSTTDSQCYYDQTVYQLANWDLRSDLSDDQIAYVHTLGINTDTDAVADSLFENASDLISGNGIYTATDGTDTDELLSQLMSIMMDIRSGFYSASTPVISTNGDYLVYSFFEVTGDDPLAEGHVRAYEIDNDPASTTYGQVQYDGATEFGGALWDGGTLLVSRIVTASESNEEDRDGIGRRDIYTFFEEGVSSLYSESYDDKRQGFDLDFVTSIGADATALDLILDTTVDPDDSSCADDQSYDLNDDCQVDDQDLQALVDFARGLPEATFRYIDQERGTWKLGDSPNAIPVIVEADSDTFAINPTYRKFLDELIANDYPSVVLLPANDGMLHAFRLEEDDGTSDTEIGEELWAWIPGYLLYREHDAEWAGRLIDQMLYGRTFLFDGSPTVDDVWIDYDGDGIQSCNSVPEDCEWRRVVVVQQGMGGPVTLALDITDPTTPEFLWEQTDEGDPTAMGYTVGQPLVGLVLDSSSGSNKDRYVAMWGSGRAVPYSTATAYYESAEGNLYMWAMGDDFYGTSTVGFQDYDSTGTARGDNDHPEVGVVSDSILSGDIDTDANYEYAYIAAALAAVDADDDGDMDTLYFPITTAYSPSDEGGSGPGDAADPGSTWMYKACINTSDPGDMTWVEFYDPIDDGSLLYRPEIYYKATAVWHDDGGLGVYWGSGSPYARDTGRKGYFFAMKDTDPLSCTSDTMTAITDCEGAGIFELDASESLTSAPLAYAGVLYFTTWVPEADRCDGGSGRVYGLRYDDCSPGMDTNDDGEADSADAEYVEFEGEVLSGVVIGPNGQLYVGSTDGESTSLIEDIQSVTDPYLGTSNVSWMELF